MRVCHPWLWERLCCLLTKKGDRSSPSLLPDDDDLLGLHPPHLSLALFLSPTYLLANMCKEAICANEVSPRHLLIHSLPALSPRLALSASDMSD